MDDAAAYDAIVLAGGTARRLGGVDKPALAVGGTTLLDRALAAAGAAGRLVVVGPQRPVAREVRWCREEPAGDGPVAALAAGLAHVDAELVLVLAADLPDVAGAVPLLLTAVGGTGTDVAALGDPGGRTNYLAAAWRRASLTSALRRLGDPSGRRMRDVFAAIELAVVPDTGGWGRDCDTWDDLDEARQRQENRS